MTKTLRILNTISAIRNSHSEMTNIYSLGSCMNFFVILKSIYPEAKAYFNVDHVITRIDDKYYDIKGIVHVTKGYLPFTTYYNKRRTSRSYIRMFKAEYEV